MSYEIKGLPFADDPEVIGKWEYRDIVDRETVFSVSKVRVPFSGRGFQEIVFLPGGEPYWIFEGWTRGVLFTHSGGDAPVIRNPYTLGSIDGGLYMFLEVRGDGEPYMEVLKKVSDKSYTVQELQKTDDIHRPFLPDPGVEGAWKAVDFVPQAGDFTPGKCHVERLWLEQIDFRPDGVAVRRYDGENWTDRWTKGFLLDLKKNAVSAYFIRRIDGREYLFLEWKMGNVVYGGLKPELYVFEKPNSRV